VRDVDREGKGDACLPVEQPNTDTRSTALPVRAGSLRKGRVMTWFLPFVSIVALVAVVILCVGLYDGLLILSISLSISAAIGVLCIVIGILLEKWIAR